MALNSAKSTKLSGLIKISATRADLPKIYLDIFSRYGPRKWLKSEVLSNAPFPDIKQGIILMRESKIGSLKYGKISERPTGSYETNFS